MKCNIRYKSELYANVKKNNTTTEILPHYPTFCRIYETKVTNLVGESLIKNSHKELIYFLYDRIVPQSQDFSLIDWSGFEKYDKSPLSFTSMSVEIFVWVLWYK